MARSYRGGRPAGAFLALVAAFFVWAGVRAVVPAAGGSVGAEGSPRIVLEKLSDRSDAIVVHGLLGGDLRSLNRTRRETEDWHEVFTVRTDAATDALPPILGRYTIEGGRVVFRPRFPLAPGTTYRALFRPEVGEPIEAEFTIALEDAPATSVVAIYPTTSTVPVNLLKMYVHFSAPMRFGEAYAHVRLLDSEGEVVPDAILEVLEELWDPDRRRLTLLFDPGRIKRDLEPNLTLGLPLREDESYVLEIDARWRDGLGRPLGAGFTKAFSVGSADRATPDPTRWTITAPEASSLRPVEVLFPESMDRALLDHMIAVVTAEGSVLDGSVEVDSNETVWRFIPSSPWARGDYTLEVDPDLEDLAGNNLAHLFDVDLSQDVRLSEEEARAHLPFTVH